MQRPKRIDQALSIGRMFRSVCRRHGIARTLRLGCHELGFDLRYRTRTSLDIPSRFPPPGPTYESTNPLIFSELLRNVPLDRERSVFLDYGAGKGRALLLAARHGFTKAIGVEISAELCAIAQENITIYRRRHPASAIEIHCRDAAAFELPDEVDVAYLFNPFGPAVIGPVIDRIRASLRRVPRQLRVIYLHPRFADRFIAAGFTCIHRHRDDAVILLHRLDVSG